MLMLHLLPSVNSITTAFECVQGGPAAALSSP